MAIIRTTGTANTDRFRKFVHQAMVVSLLLVAVVMVLIAGYCLLQVEAKGLGRVRILIQQSAGEQVVDARSVVPGMEGRFAGGIGSEVVIERNVFPGRSPPHA